MTLRTLSSFAVAAALSAITACSNDATGPITPSTNSTVSDPVSAATTGGYYGQATTARVRLIASLSAPVGGSFRRASGKASWDSRNNNTKRELEMEVEDVTAGTQVNFFVNGAKVGGTVTVDSFGNARITLSTQLGQQVPVAAAGLSAEVRTVNGAVVVTGAFPTS